MKRISNFLALVVFICAVGVWGYTMQLQSVKEEIQDYRIMMTLMESEEKELLGHHHLTPEEMEEAIIGSNPSMLVGI